MYGKSDKTLDAMLAQYRRTALLAIFFFVLSSLLIIAAIREGSTHPLFFYVIFLSAAAWIGTTALCRHAYVSLKTAMRKRIGLFEFLSTNLVVIVFPVIYRKLKREVECFRADEKGVKRES